MLLSAFFFFNDTATTEIYTLSLHDALPISGTRPAERPWCCWWECPGSAAGSARRSRWRCWRPRGRSEEHTSELQSHSDLVCRLLLEKKKKIKHDRQAMTSCNDLNLGSDGHR